MRRFCKRGYPAKGQVYGLHKKRRDAPVQNCAAQDVRAAAVLDNGTARAKKKRIDINLRPGGPALSVYTKKGVEVHKGV